MNGLRWMLALAALAIHLPAHGATTDPEIILYRFTGVLDDGGAFNTGSATSFHCTNFSGATETIRIVVRSGAAGILANSTATVPHLRSVTFSTHNTASLFEIALGTGATSGGVDAQGTAAIAATSTSIVCTAMIVNAAAAVPVGIALHGVRFNPIPGSQE